MDTRKIKNIRHSSIKMDKAINNKSTVWKRTITYKVKWTYKGRVDGGYNPYNAYKNYSIQKDGTVVGVNELGSSETWYDYSYQIIGERSMKRYKYGGRVQYWNGAAYSWKYYDDYWTGIVAEE